MRSFRAGRSFEDAEGGLEVPLKFPAHCLGSTSHLFDHQARMRVRVEYARSLRPPASREVRVCMPMHLCDTTACPTSMNARALSHAPSWPWEQAVVDRQVGSPRHLLAAGFRPGGAFLRGGIEWSNR